MAKAFKGQEIHNAFEKRYFFRTQLGYVFSM